ncbi:hypothetical protein CWE17_01575 [Synechococcus sp. BS56D]|nr:hypothetical protein CWE17_01575 [Synechococcus sp. BS56D]
MVRPAAGFWRHHLPCSSAESGTAVSGTVFSACRRYRWILSRSLGGGQAPSLIFIGLNPSRADGERDDPTLRRLQGFARSWGYGRLVVLNLFALVTPSPAVLRRSAEPVGRANDAVLKAWLRRWSLAPQQWDLWLGWGAAGGLHDRDQRLLALLRAVLPQRLACGGAPPGVLGLTRGGYPRHPLYLPAGQLLQPWIQAEEPQVRHPVPRAQGGTVRR